MSAQRLRTAAWYGDRDIALSFPDTWDVSVHWPQTPPPLSDLQIERALLRPIGRPRLRDLAQGKSRPLVIVDDLTRPTPAERVLPFVLREFAEAGIPPDQVTLLVASGTHGPPGRDAIAKKVGVTAARTCRALAHDDRRHVAKIGRTSFGTPVLVNREVLASDLVVGLAGIYPQHSTGFGGGSKLALGVLGRRSIMHLHYGHPSMAGSHNIENDFRRDLDEIARMVRLQLSISVHVNASREIVRLVSGDHEAYYREAVRFSKEAYRAPLPGDADVVVSNSYPIDVSLTFIRSKGIAPLLHAAPAASRIVVSACPEGVGHHGLFPFMDLPRFYRQRHRARRAWVRPRRAATSVARRTARRARTLVASRGTDGDRSHSKPLGDEPPRRILLHAPGTDGASLPADIPGMLAVSSWDEVIDSVRREHPGRDRLTAVIYPCAPLQVLEGPASPAGDDGE